jgi:hypothetical protein
LTSPIITSHFHQWSNHCRKLSAGIDAKDGHCDRERKFTDVGGSGECRCGGLGGIRTLNLGIMPKEHPILLPSQKHPTPAKFPEKDRLRYSQHSHLNSWNNLSSRRCLKSERENAPDEEKKISITDV